MPIALSVSRLTKIYKTTFRHQNTSFREAIVHWWQHLLRSQNDAKEAGITAINNLSFSLEPGAILGIIGRNGAGKTTLLKILAGVVRPSSGCVTYEGRLVSILQLGAGFHPDLTGRENIYLNGSLLGMSKKDVDDQFDAIVEFSELKAFIDQPVKTYSNGMYLRLAFSIFTHVTCDILLLDEVMSVGDLPFRQKSYRQIKKLAREGVTVILVSHYPDQIKELCHQCLWIESGKMLAFGPTSTVLDQYLEKSLTSVGSGQFDHLPTEVCQYTITWHEGFRIGNELSIRYFGVRAKGKAKTDPIGLTDDLEVEIEFEKLTEQHFIEITISILSVYGAWVLVDSYSLYTDFNGQVERAGHYRCTCLIPAGILNFGMYQLGFLISKSRELIYQNEQLIQFKILFQEQAGINNEVAKDVAGILKPMGAWSVQKL
jgi:lipopolysaccharide transport system ATP-binding protein